MDFKVLNGNKAKFNTNIKNAFNWLLRMQIMSGAFKGGFLLGQNYGWFSFSKPFVSAETTGYGLQILVDFLTPDNDLLKERVLAAANYLLRIQTNKGPFYQGTSFPQNEIIRTSYSFDTAICISALLDIYSIEPEGTYLDSAKKAGYWLIEEAQNDDGSFNSKYSDASESIKEVNWYGDRCCLHGKNAIALLKLWNQTGDSTFKSSAIKVADWVKSLQLPSGAYRVNAENDYTLTHVHCYATEGLLYAYYITRNESYILSAIKAARWLIGAQKGNGLLLDSYGKISVMRRLKNGLFPFRFEAVDALAQAIRIWIIAYSLNKDDVFLESACKAAGLLSRAQCTERESSLFGGFYQQINGLLRLPIMRTWSSVFSIQGLGFLCSHLDYEEMIKGII